MSEPTASRLRESRDLGSVSVLQEVDLKLWAFGEKTGRDPKDFGFRFKAGGEWHDVQVLMSRRWSLFLRNNEKLVPQPLRLVFDCVSEVGTFPVTRQDRVNCT